VHGLALAKPVTSAGNPEMVDVDAAKWMSLCCAWLENLFKPFLSTK
jgi:hypothetical protein